MHEDVHGALQTPCPAACSLLAVGGALHCRERAMDTQVLHLECIMSLVQQV